MLKSKNSLNFMIIIMIKFNEFFSFQQELRSLFQTSFTVCTSFFPLCELLISFRKYWWHRKMKWKMGNEINDHITEVHDLWNFLYSVPKFLTFFFLLTKHYFTYNKIKTQVIDNAYLYCIFLLYGKTCLCINLMLHAVVICFYLQNVCHQH